MRDPAPWQRRYGNMLIFSLLLGFAGQYLFVGNPPGLSVLLFTAGFYGLFFYSAKGRMGGFERWRGQRGTGWLLTVPAALLAVSYMLFDNPFFRTLNWFVLAALIGAQTLLLTRGGSQPWHRVAFYKDLLAQAVAAPLAHIAVPFELAAERLKSGSKEEGSGGRGKFRRVMLGLLMAAPLLIVVTVLLASADGIFMSWMNRIADPASWGSFGGLLQRFIVGALIALYAFCYIWGLLFRKETPGEAWDRPAVAEPKADRRMDPVAAGSALVSINLVYVLFAGIQFSYLFGAADGLLPEGLIYAEYARRGFAELIIVCLINQGLLIFGLHYIRPAGPAGERFRKLLLSLLTVCTAVMLLSAYSRLSLYEEAYGYTHARLLAHGFMLFLAVLMAAALVRVWLARFSLAKVYIAAAIAAYVALNYANLDARIVDGNAARYERTGLIDVDYLSVLSADAALALERLAAKYPELDGAAARLDELRREAGERRGWPSWNLAWHRLR